MIGLNTTVNAKKVTIALKELPKELEDSLNDSLKDVFYNMAIVARNTHRYTVRTGKLRSATRSMVKDLTGELFIEDLVADYGVYVHEGHHNGAWAPDQFVYKAFERGEPILMRAIDQAVDKAIKNVGL